jgi:catechol 2,3-dioxygenase-like lactoylglutathione lyase family enzyme
MQSHLGHIQFNVRPENLPFYRELSAFLGWQTIHDGAGFLGLAGTGRESLWFAGEVKAVANDYDGPGMNHLAFGVDAISEVDAAAAYLQARGVALLFETPRHRPEFAGSEDQTYYQVMFESPDRLLFEVVYTGPKSA